MHKIHILRGEEKTRERKRRPPEATLSKFALVSLLVFAGLMSEIFLSRYNLDIYGESMY